MKQNRTMFQSWS